MISLMKRTDGCSPGIPAVKAHVLLRWIAAPMQTYKESLEKLIAMESLYDITWPGHHIKPVEKQVIHVS